MQTVLGLLPVTGPGPEPEADGARAGAAAAAGRGGSDGPGRRQAMVLIRPEQVELVPGSPGPALATDGDDDGLTGRITGYGYHGHDAVVTVQPERDPQAPALTVRTLGGQALSPGSRVTLRARGPVIAWPQRGS